MADDDIERAVEIATAIKRVARQPLLIELCDDVLVMASKLTADRHVIEAETVRRHVTTVKPEDARAARNPHATHRKSPFA
jgi:hypothetical protein